MALQIKIQGGTPTSGKSLCHSCKSAQIVRGQNGEEKIVCTAQLFVNTGGVVNFKVAECRQYHPSNMPWLHEMEDMAWIVEARVRGQRGFEQNPEMEVIVTRPSRDSNTPS